MSRKPQNQALKSKPIKKILKEKISITKTQRRVGEEEHVREVTEMEGEKVPVFFWFIAEIETRNS
jgi:hypothetical protein